MKPSRKFDDWEKARELDRRAIALILQGVDIATAYRRASGIKICTYCGGKGKYSPSPLISMMAECPNCKGAGDVAGSWIETEIRTENRLILREISHILSVRNMRRD